MAMSELISKCDKRKYHPQPIEIKDVEYGSEQTWTRDMTKKETTHLL